MTRILEIHAYNACESLNDCKRLWSKLPDLGATAGKKFNPIVIDNEAETTVKNPDFLSDIRTVSISVGRYTEVYFSYPESEKYFQQPESLKTHYIELVLWFITDMFPDSFIVFAVDDGEPWCTK